MERDAVDKAVAARGVRASDKVIECTAIDDPSDLSVGAQDLDEDDQDDFEIMAELEEYRREVVDVKMRKLRAAAAAPPAQSSSTSTSKTPSASSTTAHIPWKEGGFTVEEAREYCPPQSRLTLEDNA
eukprot:5389179-Amphidinium_carterae.1